VKAEILAAAQADLLNAVSYYNEQSEGLGYEFAAEVKQTLARILRFPEAWHPLSERTRRCRTRRFPYGVVYQLRGDLVLVVAVMHLGRHPDSWEASLELTERRGTANDGVLWNVVCASASNAITSHVPRVEPPRYTLDARSYGPGERLDEVHGPAATRSRARFVAVQKVTEGTEGVSTAPASLVLDGKVSEPVFQVRRFAPGEGQV